MSLALVDFSSLFHRLWNINRVEVEHKLKGAIDRMMEDDIILCLDAPPYARKDKVPSYKANRDVPDPELIGAMRATVERMLSNGFKTARCQGWEADDVIATIVTGNTEDAVTVYGTDKDLLQVVNLTDPFTGEIKDPVSKWEVEREQVVDYLTICGDASDNVKGIEGVGQKTAVKMLSKYKTLDNIIDAVTRDPSAFTEKTAEKIMESLEWIYQSRELIALRKDLDIEYEKRDKKEPRYSEDVIDVSSDGEVTIDTVPSEVHTENKPQHIVKHVDVDYRHALEPVGSKEAYNVSLGLFNSALYQQFKSADQIMAVVMRGRALGLDATTALDQMHMIQGRPTLSSQAIIGIIKSSPICKYFFMSESTPESCTWETHRIGDPAPTKRTMTMQEANDAGFSLQPEYINKKKTGKIITKDKWREIPATMLMWRCATSLGRPVYPDLLNGIYSKEEFE